MSGSTGVFLEAAEDFLIDCVDGAFFMFLDFLV